MEARKWLYAAGLLLVVGIALFAWGLAEQDAAQRRSASCLSQGTPGLLGGLACIAVGGVTQIGLSLLSFGAATLAALIAAWRTWRGRRLGQPTSASDIRGEIDAIERELAAMGERR